MSRPPVAIKPAGAVDRFGSGMPAIGSHDESTLPDRRDGPYIDRIRWESLSGNGFGAGWSLAGTEAVLLFQNTTKFEGNLVSRIGLWQQIKSLFELAAVRHRVVRISRCKKDRDVGESAAGLAGEVG